MKLRRGLWLALSWMLLSGSAATAQQATAARDVADAPGDLKGTILRITQQENQLVTILRAHHPVAETYVQELKTDTELGTVPATDRYFLGKIDLSQGVTVDSFIPDPKFKFRLPSFRKVFSVGLLPRGFAQMMIVDGETFNPSTYTFEFVKKEFLGEVRTLVFNVAPRPNMGTGRFIGRIWVEDRGYSIVRFNGTYGPKPRDAFFLHFDSWRMNSGPGLWLPAAIYVEEGHFNYAFGMKALALKAQTRFWGYEADQHNGGGLFTGLFVDMPNVRDRSESTDASPLEGLRAWQQQAESNVVSRFEKAALLAPRGEVDKVLDTVVNNLIVTNKLELNADVYCRVLMTSPLEAFAVGHAIIVSRGLLDTLPDEASLAAVLAHELSHIALGHQLDTMFAFNDRTQFDDTKIMENLAFARSSDEEDEADTKAMELLANSPYKDKLAAPGLFLRALSARAAGIPSLTHPLFGDRFADEKSVVRMTQLMQTAPQLQIRKLDQFAAMPLGGRIRIDPWSDEIRLMHTKTLPLLSAREKMQFEVAPIYINLTHGGKDTQIVDAKAETASQPAGNTTQ